MKDNRKEIIQHVCWLKKYERGFHKVITQFFKQRLKLMTFF